MIAILGIADIRDRAKLFYYYFSWSGKFYYGEQQNKYGKIWTNQDTLTMTLDMTNKEGGILSFKVNEEDQGVATQNIDINQRYCMAAGLSANQTANLIDAWP